MSDSSKNDLPDGVVGLLGLGLAGWALYSGEAGCGRSRARTSFANDEPMFWVLVVLFGGVGLVFLYRALVGSADSD